MIDLMIIKTEEIINNDRVSSHSMSLDSKEQVNYSYLWVQDLFLDKNSLLSLLKGLICHSNLGIKNESH